LGAEAPPFDKATFHPPVPGSEVGRTTPSTLVYVFNGLFQYAQPLEESAPTYA
jgi:hypothetical protein